jgi:hypothetical protein
MTALGELVALYRWITEPRTNPTPPLPFTADDDDEPDVSTRPTPEGPA